MPASRDVSEAAVSLEKSAPRFCQTCVQAVPKRSKSELEVRCSDVRTQLKIRKCIPGTFYLDIYIRDLQCNSKDSAPPRYSFIPLTM